MSELDILEAPDLDSRHAQRLPTEVGWRAATVASLGYKMEIIPGKKLYNKDS